MLRREIIRLLAAVSLLTLGFSSLLKVSHANVALALAALLTVADGKRSYRALSQLAYFWIAAFFLAYVLLRAAFQLLFTPEALPLVSDQITDYIKFCFLPALFAGYLFYRHPRLIIPAIALMPLGFATRIALRWDSENGMRVLRGVERATFGDSAGSFGVLGVTVIFCGLLFIHLSLRDYLGDRQIKLWKLLLGIVYLIFGIACTFFSQTRTAWIIAAAATPLYIAAIAFLFHGKRGASIAAAAMALLTALAIAPLLSGSEVFIGRWHAAQEGLAMLFSGDWADAGTSSIGLRLRMLDVAWKAFLDKPLFGWGLGTDTAIMAASADPAVAGGGFTHFHNQAAWLLVELGIIGFLLYFCAIFIPMLYVAPCLKEKTDRGPLALFSFFCLASLAAACMTNLPLTSYRGPFLFALTGGICVFLKLARQSGVSSRRMDDGADRRRTSLESGNALR